VLLGVALGGIIYSMIMALLKVPELAKAAAVLRRRIASLNKREAIHKSSGEDK
jgi:hypothetical protein